MIHHSAVIYSNVVIGDNVTIEAGSIIGVPGAIRGAKSFVGYVIIKDNVKIGANVTIAIGDSGNTIIGNDCLIMNKALIGHNVTIGNNCEIGADSNICGYAEIGDNVRIKTGVNVRNRVKIAKGITIGIGSNVLNDLNTPNLTMVGSPCEEIIV